MKLTVAIFISAVLAIGSNAAVKSLVKVSHMSETQVAVSCVSGMEPVATRMGDVVILACK